MQKFPHVENDGTLETGTADAVHQATRRMQHAQW